MKFEWDFSELTEFAERLTTAEEFDKYIGKATQEIAKKLHQMLITNTPVATGTLKAFWQTDDNYSYKIKRVKNGFEVELKNEAVYARAVNDGHYSKNQFGGPYFVYNRTPKLFPEYGENDEDTFVFGHFFVEGSIDQLKDSKIVESIVNAQLKKWFRWCVNGN